MRRLLNYFLNGLLVTVPLAITVYIVYNLFIFFDELWPFEHAFPGLGLIIIVLIIALFGWLGTTLIAIPFRNWFDRLIRKAPLIKTIYNAIKDLVSAFVGQKKRFNQPVLVKLNRENDLEQLGFITDTDLSKLGIYKGKVAVYIPHSYAFSGNLFIVPTENVTLIDGNASEIMKYIVSGGVSEVEKEDYEQEG